ncbi:hypothetical protein Pfo_011410 [Paulownia fortunei]|nr:hypothetical protein Pfo_011410 [Paulownia fortunei]
MGSEEEILPIGWRFVPTDEELIRSYLAKKVGSGSLPAQVIKEIDATEFYSKHPKDLVENLANQEEDRYFETERYFFIHGDDYFHGEMKRYRRVGDGIGYWRSIGKEDPICDGDGNVFAFKIHSTYFSANSKPKKTHWKMEEYRLFNLGRRSSSSSEDEEDLHVEEWVVARITRGNSYIKRMF